ncbi:flavodoxin family protein [Desulfosporosinus sp. PR]|uniref:flavodoxin family protein n=1 Tax=Candidatus Desulfosporosinus nitrosoreducens TaxID=3401928 RepID=UPI0027F930D1|nr:flavodoxin family protein [Desulfosporosinus sp. PR]MDQ7094955.1 flavodoxin family protein [Desulfosporosinus sp. PR]
MSLSILGIACSPRPKSNSSQLLLEGLKTAQTLGGKTELVYLADLKIHPCRGCGACSTKGVCVIRDDIPMLQEKLKQADRVVIAAPIYFMGVNAQTKILLDRMQPFWALKYLHRQPTANPPDRKRSGIFISTAGTRKPDVFKCAERSIQTFFHMLDIRYFQPCLYSGVDQAGEIFDHPTAFEEVRSAIQILLAP